MLVEDQRIVYRVSGLVLSCPLWETCDKAGRAKKRSRLES